MEVTKNTVVKITPKELELIVITHLKRHGVEVNKVSFEVNMKDHEGDWRAELSQYPDFDGVTAWFVGEPSTVTLGEVKTKFIND